MRFTKMHGIGNDYIYIDTFQDGVADPANLAVRLADRHFGVGGDGLILVCPPTRQGRADGADVRMRMFNADGSESEMCGNGIRCVAKYAFDRGISRSNPMRVETGRGVLTLDLWLRRDRVHRATVNMGKPILTPRDIPVLLTGMERAVNVPVGDQIPLDTVDEPPGWQRRCGFEPNVTCVSMGNPHAVFYCADVNKAPLEKLGPLIERHPLFPHRVNVHLVAVHGPGEVTMRTWERGSGITMACGTGAAAVCVAGVLTGKSERIVLANLPGGQLALKWNDADDCLYMTGPAVEVFSGEWVGDA